MRICTARSAVRTVGPIILCFRYVIDSRKVAISIIFTSLQGSEIGRFDWRRIGRSPVLSMGAMRYSSSSWACVPILITADTSSVRVGNILVRRRYTSLGKTSVPGSSDLARLRIAFRISTKRKGLTGNPSPGLPTRRHPTPLKQAHYHSEWQSNSLRGRQGLRGGLRNFAKK